MGTLIMTMGIAVEFTAHTVLAYICAPAPVGVGVTSYEARQHCTEVALGRMAVPTVHGSITTFLGIVMISISKSKFIVLYYFVLYAFIVLFGFSQWPGGATGTPGRGWTTNYCQCATSTRQRCCWWQ